MNQPTYQSYFLGAGIGVPQQPFQESNCNECEKEKLLYAKSVAIEQHSPKNQSTIKGIIAGISTFTILEIIRTLLF